MVFLLEDNGIAGELFTIIAFETAKVDAEQDCLRSMVN
jgi:hypothetical protein